MMHRAVGHVVWQKTRIGRRKRSIMTTKKTRIINIARGRLDGIVV